MKNILSVAFTLMLTLFMAACSGDSSQKQTSGEDTHKTPAAGTPEATTQMAYMCPMQCEGSASHEPGKCPVCSMDLVKNPNYKATTPDSAAVIN